MFALIRDRARQEIAISPRVLKFARFRHRPVRSARVWGSTFFPLFYSMGRPFSQSYPPYFRNRTGCTSGPNTSRSTNLNAQANTKYRASSEVFTFGKLKGAGGIIATESSGITSRTAGLTSEETREIRELLQLDNLPQDSISWAQRRSGAAAQRRSGAPEHSC